MNTSMSREWPLCLRSPIASTVASTSLNTPSTPCMSVPSRACHGASTRRDDLLQLGDRQNRQLLDEQQEPHEEPAEAAEQNPVVDERRIVVRPLPRLELVRQPRHDDHKPLEPHAEVDKER